MRAARVTVQVVDHMRLAATDRPAVTGHEERAGFHQRHAPVDDVLCAIVGSAQQVDRTGRFGQQRFQRARGDLQRFLRIGAALQQAGVAAERLQVGAGPLKVFEVDGQLLAGTGSAFFRARTTAQFRQQDAVDRRHHRQAERNAGEGQAQQQVGTATRTRCAFHQQGMLGLDHQPHLFADGAGGAECILVDGRTRRLKPLAVVDAHDVLDLRQTAVDQLIQLARVPGLLGVVGNGARQ
ncbi:hypothetical protein D3C81_1324740 [compost metagenome]